MLDKKVSLNKILDFGFLLCIFLAALNFVSRYFYFIFIAFAFFAMMPRQKVRGNWSTLFLLVFALALLVFDPNSHKSITNMIRPFTYFITYTMGISLLRGHSSPEEREQRVRTIILLLAGGAFLHYILNMMINLEAQNRNVVDYWTRLPLSATGQACLACMAVGVIMAVLCSDAKLKWKLLAGSACAVVGAYNLVLAGRTLIFLMAGILALAFIHRILAQPHRFGKMFLWSGIVFAAIFLLYQWDVFGIRTIIEGSNLYRRFLGDEASLIINDARAQRKLLYLEYIWEYPMGGSNILTLTGEYAHDLYLDTYDQAGVFSLIAIVAYILASWYRLWRIMKEPGVSFFLKQLLLCLYVVINIQFWLEPILLGVPWLLAAYCMIDGMVAYLLVAVRRENAEDRRPDLARR